MEEKRTEERVAKQTGQEGEDVRETCSGSESADAQGEAPVQEEQLSPARRLLERDRQVMRDARAIRADMWLIEEEKRQSFYKGVGLGSFAMLLVCLIIVFVLPAVAGRVRGRSGQTQARSQEEEGTLLTGAVRNKVEQLADIIDMLYYEDVDEEDLVDGLYKGLFAGTGDVYSDYFTPEEYESFMISATSSLCGIGASLQQEAGTMQVVIKKVYEGSPAEKAGLKEGDRIVKVDDIVSSTMELSELVTHIRGDEGTRVHLKIYRAKEHDYVEMDVKRAVVDMPTVSGEMLQDGIGYIMIAEFGESTDKEFSKTVKELKAQGMTSMIVDVRDNPGGLITSVTGILDEILPKGVIVWTEDKAGNKKEYKSDASCMDYPMAVLINSNSASAAEIFAGAIRDYKYGTLIGKKTFGKGIVQSVRQLKDGSAIKITTARYFTPSGENIHGAGIEPDVELEYEYLNPDAEVYDMMEDNQILKAIEVLQGE